MLVDSTYSDMFKDLVDKCIDELVIPSIAKDVVSKVECQ